MADRKTAKIQADSVDKTACPQCGHVVDVSDKEAFATARCPECDVQFATPGVLGQFVLLKRLGAGGMGATFKAYEKSLGRHVAVKILHAPREGESERHIERFFSEARALASLDHPNVARAYSVGEAKGQPFLVMELIVGNALDQLLKLNSPLDEAMTLEIGAQMARALQAAAAIGLIHGDVKPSNILVDAEGHAKLVDFGIARFGGGRITSGDALGTPYYLSPEQVRRQTLDFRTDIYSLGATLFHAVAGRPPFEGKHTRDVLIARLKHPAPYLLAANHDLHAPTADVVARMLQTDPDARYGDYDELIADLDRAAAVARSGENLRPAPLAPHELNAPSFEDDRPHPGQAPHPGGAAAKRGKGPLLAGAAVVVVVLALAGAAIWAISINAGWLAETQTQRQRQDPPPDQGDSVDPASLPQAGAPVFDPVPGPIARPTHVTVTCPTDGAVIRYTVDRGEPSENSRVLGKSIIVQPGMFFRIRAYRQGCRPSDVVDGYYEEVEVDVSALESLRREAGQAWQHVQGLDRGQGFGRRIEQCSAIFTRAEKHYTRDEFAEATAAWQKLIEACKGVGELATKRGAAAEARKSAELARKGLGEPVPPGAARAAYDKDAKAAVSAFEAGDFDKARDLWGSARAHAQAEGVEVVRRAKKSFEAECEKHRIDDLKEYGGNDWLRFDAAQRDARASEAKLSPARIAAKYKLAADMLPKVAAAAEAAAAKAAEDAAKLDRKITAARDEALELIKAGMYHAALDKAKSALAMKPSDGKIQALVKQIESKLKLTIKLDNRTSLTFVLLKPGKFTMGSPDDERDREKNEQEHQVELTKAFYMSTHEMTVAQFAAFAAANRFRTMAEKGDGADVYVKRGDNLELAREKGTSWRNCGFEQNPDHPVVCVSRLDVNRVCAWLSGKARMTVRLPTETEWEYACRAGKKTAFSFGNEERQINRYGNIADRKSLVLLRVGHIEDRHAFTAPVGTYQPNAWGLYDMHGNVAEWCLDGGVLYTAKGVAKDPRGRVGGPTCAVRGGGWDTRPSLSRSAARHYSDTRYRSSGIGFRLVAEVK